jgi:hypothetical protein
MLTLIPLKIDLPALCPTFLRRKPKNSSFRLIASQRLPHAEVAAYQHTQMTYRSAAIWDVWHGAVGCFKPECYQFQILVCAMLSIISQYYTSIPINSETTSLSIQH